MRLGYAKPELKKEVFTPHEEAAVCMQPLTDFSPNIYLDLNHSGHYTRGEFMNSLARLSAPDGHYLGVQPYALLRSTEEDSPFEKYDVCFSVYNHPYSTTDFTLAGRTAPRYRFLPLTVVDVKVDKGRAYFNLT